MHYKSLKSGFTLLEVMVVTTIIALLTSVVAVNLNQARAQARDVERAASLQQLQVAIQLYRAQYDQFPNEGCDSDNEDRDQAGENSQGVNEWFGEGPHENFSRNSCSDYIDGLVPNFIDQLPSDPKNELEPDSGFVYRTADTNGDGRNDVYKIMVTGTVEVDLVDGYGHELARCPESIGTEPCPDSGPPANDYAIYSAGAEGW